MAAIAAAAVSLPFSLSPSSRFTTTKARRGRFMVFAASKGGEENGFDDKKNSWNSMFSIEDPRSKLVPQGNRKFLDVNQALEVARYDLQYCDRRARQDILTIMLLHEKVVDVLNPLAREYKSVGTLKKDLRELQEELAQAHKQVHISEARVSAALDKLAYMETLVNDKLLEEKTSATYSAAFETAESKAQRKSIRVSGPVKPYHPCLKNFWYPVAFSRDLKDDTLIPIECFEEPWVVFRGKDGKPGCVKNTCAHRACPLDLGSVNEGRVQCPYHGWEYSTDGKCEKMPSTKFVNVKIKSLPCVEHEHMIWIWPGNEPSSPIIPSLKPPPGFQIHAESEGSNLEAFAARSHDSSFSWKDIAWLKSITKLPIMIKGILTREDATKAMEVGVEGIIVSNHGARQLNYVPATITVLEEVVNAVQGKVPVLFDGGIRRGTDVFKALALGANAVMIGRPILYGLAAKGEYGVRRVIEMLKDELELTMALSGCPTLKDITRNHVRTQNDSHHCRL